MKYMDLTSKRTKMLSYVANHSKQLKPSKVFKLQWTASIWCQKHQTTQNYKSDQITTKCMDLTSQRTKMLSYIGNHSKQRKSTKVIKVQWSAWIWRQNEQKCWVTSQTIQNNSNLQKYSNYNELHRFDVKNIKQRKTTKVIKLRLSAWIRRQNEQKCLLRRKPFKTTQIYKSYQSTMKCMDLTSKRTKMLSYVANHSKQLKPSKVFKLQWTASIWCQKHQTTQNYKSDQITMKCMDLTSKRTKMLSYVANHSKQRKSKKVIKIQWIASIWCQNDKMLSYVPNHSKHSKTKMIKLRWIASIWRQNDQKCLVTSQTIQNNSNLQKYSNYNELHRFDVKNIKQRKTTKVIKLRLSAWIWRQNEQKCFVTSETIQNNANLQKLSKYNEVHGFDVKTNKNVELRRKPFKTTQTFKSIQITMNCIDLMSKTSNNAKLQKWSNYDKVHGFDVKTIKNV